MSFDPQGLQMCSRYALAPNSLHYCGPERQADLLGYVNEHEADRGLVEILNRFETLYPYLVLIASENHIPDPFDKRVVEAYWLGNSFLRRVHTKAYGDHLAYSLELKKKVSHPKFSNMMDHVVGGVPQHTFHVLNVFIRTGHHSITHTIDTMDHCRISWGRVERELNDESANLQMKNTATAEKHYIVTVQPLEYDKGKLELGSPTHKVVSSVTVAPRPGEWVSIHWGQICDTINPGQRKNLHRYTQFALAWANKKSVV